MQSRTGSGFYRDNLKLVCMGHPDCRRPCRFEPDAYILKAAHRGVKTGRLTRADLRCILLDMEGYPGKVILEAVGKDLTGAVAKRAKYACERAYAKIGRRLCLFCQMLWAADRPKGPRLDADQKLKYLKEDWRSVRESQDHGGVRLRRRKGAFSLADWDQAIS